MNENGEKQGELIEALPEADADVVARDQVASTDGLQVGILVDREAGGLPASSLYIALHRLAEADGRKIGFPVLLQFASAWANEMHTKFSILGSQNAKLSDDLTKAREENAALKAKNAERTKHGPLVNAALLMGPIIVAIGLEQVNADHWGTGIVASIIGATMICAALWSRRGDQ